MRKAKYYIYRNLHKKSFSVKYRGRVIAHPTDFIANDCEFRVSESGRQRVLKEKQKNVHAQLACDSWEEIAKDSISVSNTNKIYYNPYITKQFQYNGSDILSTDTVVGLSGRYIHCITL